jgi:2-haloalkanoic acid dehalogenase type II
VKIKAIAFDVDGTLYPDRRFWIRLAPYVVTRIPLLLAMAVARNELRSRRHFDSSEDFYVRQAKLAARKLKKPEDEVRILLDAFVYTEWIVLFKKVRAFSRLKETLESFRSAGLKLAVLSDFPPEEKIRYLGLEGFWDALLCSEKTGHLKPAPEPFRALSRALDLPPEQILFVGNSVRYDIRGAKNAGMRTALISRKARTISEADIVFRRYSELEEKVRNIFG